MDNPKCIACGGRTAKKEWGYKPLICIDCGANQDVLKTKINKTIMEGSINTCGDCNYRQMAKSMINACNECLENQKKW